MTEDKKPEALEDQELPDDALDDVQGGGLLDAEPGTFGAKGRTREGVWKAPAGVDATITHERGS